MFKNFGPTSQKAQQPSFTKMLCGEIIVAHFQINLKHKNVISEKSYFFCSSK
jgi:hypothetical protein